MAWSPRAARPPDVPACTWKEEGFVFLGSPVAGEDEPSAAFLRAGVSLGSNNAMQQHWHAAADGCVALLAKLRHAHSRRAEAGQAQGEAVLNASQLCQLMLRLCVEPKLVHLLRASPPGCLGHGPALMDATLQAAFASITELGPLQPHHLEQMSLPVQQGGCGIGALSLKHGAAFAGSWALCLAPVLARLPVADAAGIMTALQVNDRTHPVAASLLLAQDVLRTSGVSSAKLPDWGAVAKAPRRGCQHTLSAAAAVAARERLLAGLELRDAARVRSCGGDGAGQFLVCPAREGWRTELFDGAFCHAVRWRLGVPTTSAGQTCHIRCQASGGRCAPPLDPLGHHAVVCKYGGFKTFRHSRLVHELRGVLRESGAVVPAREVEVPGWQRADGTRARLDVAFAWAGRECYADVTIRHPCAAKYVRQAGAQDGAALRLAEAGKRSRYPAVAAAGLDAVEPFAVETFGRLGPNAVRLLRTARQQAAERQAPYARWAGPALHQKWLASLSCSLQQALYEASRASWGSRAPEADLSGFGR